MGFRKYSEAKKPRPLVKYGMSEEPPAGGVSNPAGQSRGGQADKTKVPLLAILVEQPFFEGFKPEQLKELAKDAVRVRFTKGDFLFHEWQEAEWFYLLCDGHVAIETFIEDQGPTTIQTLGKAEVLGWSCLVPPHFWRFNARALENIQVVAIDGKVLRDRCENDHDFGYEILKRISIVTAQRLELTRLSLVTSRKASGNKKR